MYSLSVKQSFVKTVIFTFLYFLSIQFVKAAPVLLDNAELDRISAGYVDLEVNAKATATGRNAVSRFSANVEQTISEVQPDGYIYTTTTGLANAYARGKVVSTEVGYFLQTDEEILSFSVLQNFSSRKSLAKNGKKNQTGKASNKKSNRKKKNLNKQKNKKRQNKQKNKNQKKKHRKGSKKKKAAAKRDKKNSSARKKNQSNKAKRIKKAKLARKKGNRRKAAVVRENRQLNVSIVTRQRADS